MLEALVSQLLSSYFLLAGVAPGAAVAWLGFALPGSGCPKIQVSLS